MNKIEKAEDTVIAINTDSSFVGGQDILLTVPTKQRLHELVICL